MVAPIFTQQKVLPKFIKISQNTSVVEILPQ